MDAMNMRVFALRKLGHKKITRRWFFCAAPLHNSAYLCNFYENMVIIIQICAYCCKKKIITQNIVFSFLCVIIIRNGESLFKKHSFFRKSYWHAQVCSYNASGFGLRASGFGLRALRVYSALKTIAHTITIFSRKSKTAIFVARQESWSFFLFIFIRR